MSDSNSKILMDGLWHQNPIFMQILGMCPTLAVTTSAENGIGMGLATTFVLVGSNIGVSLIRNFIPSDVRIPAYIVVIATFVTVVDLLMNAFVYDLHKVLGLFIPLIVVNCIILGRAEAFASKNGVLSSTVDGLAMGVGFTFALTLLGSVREIIGSGKIFGLVVMGEGYHPAIAFILPPGAFIALGFILMTHRWLDHRREEKAKAAAAGS